MPNLLTKNPLEFDTSASSGVQVPGPIVIVGIVVIADGDTWSCILRDADANIVFRADSNIANHRSVYWSPAAPFVVNGLRFATDTNIAIVLVYTARPVPVDALA